ncbi:acid protease [Delitschia confertaspora ATCC 74209]|uniref:Acid protease n=1 Tax=Delitschia confertaspora ATCC 74209 TaxID=1513339 RepID=A0A9P4MMA5_9PLEO|nr:acid protease [Delitschia confertaspora ATCC 74209]
MGGATKLPRLVTVLATLFAVVAGAENNNTNLGKPISIPASQFWDGKDGPWSTFRIQVGSPPQQIHVLPASDQSSTWLVIPEGCNSSQDKECEENRGNTYKRDNSSTWQEYGGYELNTYLEKRINLTGDGLYGFDTLELGWVGDNMPKLPDQLVTGIFTTDFYLGSLALNPRPTNFTNYNTPIPSLMQTLRSNVTTPIPSTTWSYTAGSHNLSPKVFASLILGGYDSTRFAPNNVTFPFGADISFDFQVTIQSVTTNLTDKPLLNTGITSYINTLVPDIWLPTGTCKLFEDAFGLKWDEKTQLYLLDDKLHESLLEKNPVVSFKVGPQLTGPSVTIDMPYWNFYQTATSAYIGNSSGLYFPLKRAANDTQYILGRTFLQSAYLGADYERNTFNLSQALYPASSVEQKIVAIYPPSNETSHAEDKTKKSSGLSIGVIVGIVIGAVVGALIIGIIFFIFYRRRKTSHPYKEPREMTPELDDTDRHRTLGVEVDGDDRKLEMGEGLRHEVAGDWIPKVELSAGGDHQKPAEADGVRVEIYEMPADDPKLTEMDGGMECAEMDGGAKCAEIDSRSLCPEMEGEGHVVEKSISPHAKSVAPLVDIEEVKPDELPRTPDRKPGQGK